MKREWTISMPSREEGGTREGIERGAVELILFIMEEPQAFLISEAGWGARMSWRQSGLAARFVSCKSVQGEKE